MRYSPPLQRLIAVFGRVAGRRAILIPLLVGVVVLSGAWLGREPELRAARCAGGLVTVIAQMPADRAAACAGAENAIAVLDRLDLPVLNPLVVHVVDEITIMHGASALGTFDAKTRLVKALARSAYSVGSTDEAVLGLPFDDVLHESVFAHEVAHAVFHQHEDTIPLSPVAHEYVAYSVQLTTLPEDHRRRILDRFAVSAFTDVTQVNATLFAFDPNGFGIKAYLHFRDAADQHAVLRSLVRASRSGVLEWY